MNPELLRSLAKQLDVTAAILWELADGPEAAAGSKIDLESIPLSTRARKILVRLRIETMADLVRFSRRELLQQKGAGEKSVDEIAEQMRIHGFSLRGDSIK